MVRGVNKVILVGNLAQDPTSNFTQSGGAVVNFTLAVNRTWRDRNTNERREQTEWVRIVCFGPLAENANQYLNKGSPCYVEGRLQTRSYEQNGERKYITEVIANDITFLSSPAGGSAGPGSTEYGQQPPRGGQASRQPDPYQDEVTFNQPSSTGSSSPSDDIDDDIPF